MNLRNPKAVPQVGLRLCTHDEAMSLRSPALFAGVAVTALLGGAGVAYAATHSSSTAAAQTTSLSGTPASSAPGSSAPGSSAPGSSAAGSSAPGSSAPGSAASSAPGAPAPASSAPATTPPGKRAWGRFPRFGLGLGIGGVGGLGGLGGGAIHGQLTVPKSGGGYQTVDVQSGTVSSVSPTSITVKSADGFTATYAVTSSTEVNAESAGIGSVKSGDTVFVMATTSGSSATASDVTDITSIKNSRGAFGFPVPAQRVPASTGSAGSNA